MSGIKDEMIEAFARDLTKSFHELDPSMFDKKWDELTFDERYDVMKLSNKILEKGWRKDV